MKNSVLQLFLLILFIFLFKLDSSGQISKGDFILDFKGNAYNLFKGSERQSVYTSATYLRLVSDKWMIGGSINYSHDHNGVYSSNGRFIYPFNSYSISPTFRYYFSNAKLAPFTSLENIFLREKFIDEGPFDNFFGYQAIAGVGLDYFLGNNIAVEAILTSNIANLGDYKGQKTAIFASAGLRLFFNNSLSKPNDSLASKVLKKGVFTTSSLLGFSHRFSEPSTGYIGVQPDIRYFIRDRFNLFGSLGFTQYRFKTNDQYILRLSLGTEYYFKLHSAYYIRAGVKGDFSLDHGKLKDIFKRNYTRIVLPLSSDFNYFLKNKRLYSGFEYTYSGLFSSKNKLYEIKSNKIYAGLDYYLSQNIYVNGEIGIPYSKGNLFKRNSKVVAFRIGFLLDSNQFEP